MGYDYSKLDNVGLIQENSIVDDKTKEFDGKNILY